MFPAVSDSFFPTKFPFEANGTIQYNTLPAAGIERGVTRLDLTTKPLGQYSAPTKRSEERENLVGKETIEKKLFNDFVIIKSELDDVNKGEGETDPNGNDNCRDNKDFKQKKLGRCRSANAGDLESEPDSTECKVLGKFYFCFFYFIFSV